MPSTDRNQSSAQQQCSSTSTRPACPACGGPLMEIKHKLQCAQCRTICETCCEGGRG